MQTNIQFSKMITRHQNSGFAQSEETLVAIIENNEGASLVQELVYNEFATQKQAEKFVASLVNHKAKKLTGEALHQAHQQAIYG